MRIKRTGYVWIFFLAFFMITGCSSENKQKQQSPTEGAVNNTSAANSVNRSGRNAGDGSLGEIPDYEFDTLSGERIKISDYNGNVVMINFWATWCGPCRKEIPELVKLKEKYGEKGLEIIGIALDEEGFQAVEPFLKQFDINYTIVTDDYSYGNELGGIYMVPTTYLVDKEGKIAFRKIGEITVENIESRIVDLL